MSKFNILGATFRLEGETKEFEYKLTGHKESDGIVLLKLVLNSECESIPPKLSLEWTIPGIEIHTRWHPNVWYSRGILPDWNSDACKSKATSGGPVQTLFNYNGENKLTIAISDALNPLEIHTGLNEETGNLICKVNFFNFNMSPIFNYEATIRLDTRCIPYYECLDQVQKWWAKMPGYEPTMVPEHARLPMYSAWYSFHQQIDTLEIIKQCKMAKEIGCETIILDDGWQTDDNGRGYAYCGDWEVATGKIPDMKEFVASVHDTGLKFMLWYSVPFVGRFSKAWDKFKDKFLDSNGDKDVFVLDPRFPEVREYLINIYERAVIDWDLDGLKLDFVDSFWIKEAKDPDSGMDYLSLEQAVDKLLKDTVKRLSIIKSDILLEFRQSYIGPLMRTYGNMFRAGDVPNDSLGNRIRTLDIRLICGTTAAHSDMLMWHNDDTVESAAFQIINILYSVPQISVLLDKLPKSHYKMLKFWMKFWGEHRDVLLDGTLTPFHPESSYSSVTATNNSKLIATVYSNPVVTLPDAKFKEVILINGSYDKHLFLETALNHEDVDFEVFNCCGESVNKGTMNLNKGINSFEVVPAGLIRLRL